MKILEKLKKFLNKKQPESQKIEININDLDKWLEGEKNKNALILKNKFSSLLKELLIIIKSLEINIISLENVKISERKEPEKIKQITELGRQDYIQNLKKLIKNLKEINLEEDKSGDFVINEVNNFAKYSAKGHFNATILIGKEIEEIDNKISKIKSLAFSFNKDNQELIRNIQLFSSLIGRNMNKKLEEEQKQIILSEMFNTKCQLENYNAKVDQIQRNIDLIKISKEAKEKENLIIDKNRIHDSINIIQSNLRDVIDKRSLEKYAYIEKDKLKLKIIHSYIENPLKALHEDENLAIHQILEEIIGKIKAKEIKLKEENKIINKLTIDKNSLSQNKLNIDALIKKARELESKISSIKLANPELEKELINTKSKISETEDSLEIINKKLLKLEYSITNTLEEIKNLLKEQNLILT